MSSQPARVIHATSRGPPSLLLLDVIISQVAYVISQIVQFASAVFHSPPSRQPRKSRVSDAGGARAHHSCIKIQEARISTRSGD